MLNTTRIANGNLVAGAAAEGHGVLVGWSGRGEISRAKLVEIADMAGIPREWCPRAKDAAVQLTRAARNAGGGDYNAEQARRPAEWPEGERVWDSRWMLVRRAVAGDQVLATGAAFGEIVLIATLFVDELVIDSADDVLAQRVRADFRARVDAERYVAADVTAWLGDLLRMHMDAVRYGGNWYVPRLWRALAEAICTTLRESGWGHNWMAPALPIATSAQLSMGLALGLELEVGEVLADLAKDRERARAAGREDIGVRAAETYMVRLRGVGQRVVAYADLLGAELAADVRLHIHDAMVELDGVLDGVSFEAEWAKVEAERAANGGAL